MNQLLVIFSLLLFLSLPQVGCNKTSSGQIETDIRSAGKSYNNPLLFEGQFGNKNLIRMILFLDGKDITGRYYSKADYKEISLTGNLLPNNKLMLKSETGIFEGKWLDSLFSGSYRDNVRSQQFQKFEFKKIELGYEISTKKLSFQDSTKNTKVDIKVHYPVMESERYTAFQEEFNIRYDTTARTFFNEYENMFRPFLKTDDEEKQEEISDTVFIDSYKIPQVATSYYQITFVSPSVLSISQKDFVWYGGNRAWDFYHLDNINLLLARKERFKDQFIVNSGANLFIAKYSYEYLKKNNPEIFEINGMNTFYPELTVQKLDYETKNNDYNIFNNFSFSNNHITIIVEYSTDFGRLTNFSIEIPFNVLKPYVAKNSILDLIMKER